MVRQDAGVMIGEDALSYCSGQSTSDSSFRTMKSTSLSSSWHSMASPHTSDVQGVSFFRPFSWFVWRQTEKDLKKKQDKETVDEIMKCFRNNDVDGMEKFVEKKTRESVSSMKNDEFWWDDDEISYWKHRTTPAQDELPEDHKYTPHPSKGFKLPPRVLKAVRFELDNTPEDRQPRPFTPLYTSTPKNPAINEDGSDDEYSLVPLRYCDSNTVAVPAAVFNNTSSILLDNAVIMTTLNKSREETNEILCKSLNRDFYQLAYVDSEDAEQDHGKPEQSTQNPLCNTYVVHSSEEMSSEPSSSTINLDQANVSDDARSAILGLDRVENAIQRALANQNGPEQGLARQLRERIQSIKKSIDEICSECPNGPEIDTDRVSRESDHDVSADFEDSDWQPHLESDVGSFDECML
ncbi:Kinesin Cargo Adaptor [Caenorhabditis elegans]|uniref:Kinesin 1 cargo adaptor alternative variant a n=1 Tax=Caenorhabditis elegans TaxID=6239 RepID=G5EBU5_CAEEL|nr:Kinesin Cargo Adaptor [Caenorhabditis elegans]ABA18182.1 kinesin 1 cargo adaptor alternative variant a [Caenorhabditis elegans]CCD64222.1 Kinesin Cargo Adaptor [Caenorhabditis elegans]|eukprot:NP_491443.3 Kinesin Cargo Adaptor [Caenorhabditis elegans]